MNETVHLSPLRSADPAKAGKSGKLSKVTKPAKAATTSGRTNDPARTMAGILDVATKEFAEKGLSGGRIDEIAAATQTSKRMIYYYFGSKEGLYVAVLEEAYRRMRAIEAELHLDDLPPEDALRKLVGFTFDHHHDNPDFIRLVMTENMERGAFMARSEVIQKLNVTAISLVQKLYERGVASGVFRANLDAIDLHASISALTFFNVANRHTFSLIFKRDFDAPRVLRARRDNVIELIVRFVRK